MKQFSFYLLLLFFVSCGSQKDVYDTITYTDFPITVDLKGEHVKLSDSIILSFPRIVIDDSLCCVYDSGSKDKLFHIFSFPDLKHIRSFGNFGNGNNEFNDYFTIQLANNYLYALGAMTNKIYVFDLKNEKSELSQVAKFDFPIKSFSVINDTTIVHGSDDDNFGILISSMAGNKLDSLFKYPKIDHKSEVSNSDLWSNIQRYNAKRDVVVSALNFGEALTIIDMKDKSTTVAVGKLGKPSQIFFRDSYIQAYLGFLDVFLTDKYIYTLFSGVKVEDAIKQDSDLEIKIYVYDYDGNPVKQINVDKGKTFYSLYVDEQTQKIYCIASQEENPIYIYNLL